VPLCCCRRHGLPQNQKADHLLRTATSRLRWFLANRELFAEGDEAVIRTTLVRRHLGDHEQAVREGDADHAAENVATLVELAGPPAPSPTRRPRLTPAAVLVAILTFRGKEHP
jgi:hypothetical protein